jgi:hypothetical protein
MVNAAFGSGDVTQDGTVNASDATSVLVDAAYSGVMGRSNLTNTQRKSGDVNGDGLVNAKDATCILRYAAVSGSGSFQGSMEEYLRQNNM